MHHILYEDGESEWVCLPKEAHAWVPGLQSAPYPAGLPPGEASPFSCLFHAIRSAQLQQHISCLLLLQACMGVRAGMQRCASIRHCMSFNPSNKTLAGFGHTKARGG